MREVPVSQLDVARVFSYPASSLGWLCNHVHDPYQVCRRSRARPLTWLRKLMHQADRQIVQCIAHAPALRKVRRQRHFGRMRDCADPQVLCVASVNVSAIAGQWTQPHLDSVRNSQICIEALTILSL